MTLNEKTCEWKISFRERLFFLLFTPRVYTFEILLFVYQVATSIYWNEKKNSFQHKIMQINFYYRSPLNTLRSMRMKKKIPAKWKIKDIEKKMKKFRLVIFRNIQNVYVYHICIFRGFWIFFFFSFNAPIFEAWTGIFFLFYIHFFAISLMDVHCRLIKLICVCEA